jgi:hypothetical protein
MSLFHSRQQYNKITQSFASIFDIKLSTVRHKVSLDEGYKNSNAHLSKLKDEVPLSSDKTIKETFDVDALSHEFLSETISFEINTKDENNTPVVTTINAPRAIKYIFDGHMFTSQYWLTKPVFHFDLSGDFETESTEDYSDASISYHFLRMDYSFDENAMESRYCFSLALIQQIVNNTFILTDTKLLIENPKILFELIDSGSMAQYNAICQNHDLVMYLTDNGEIARLGLAYITLLNNLSNEEVYDFNSDAHYLNEYIGHTCYLNPKHTIASAEQALITLATPPLHSLTTIDDQCHENSVVCHLLECMFPLANEPMGDSPFLELLTSIDENLDTKDYVLSEREFAFMKHASFGVQHLCRQIIEEQGNEHAVCDLLACLSYYRFLDLDFPEFQLLLRAIPNNDLYFNAQSLEEYDWENTTLATWLVCSKLNSDLSNDVAKNIIELLFKTANEETLNQAININLIEFIDYVDDDSISTVKDLLTFALQSFGRRTVG